MENINEIVVGVVGVVVAGSGWVVKTLHSLSERNSARVSLLEKNLVDRPYMETQLAPIRQDLNLILSHLLERRKTEDSPARVAPVLPVIKSS